jgi:hypothetical protein
MTIAAECSGRRVPDFFVVGHPKSGTTALYEMLRRHPQIYMPDLKEPAYLAPDQPRRRRRAAAGALPATLSQYLALFAPAKADQRVGEASSGYLASRAAPGRIAEIAPGARAIAILREPASLLRSLHLQLLQDHVESVRDLRRALALEPARRRGRRIPRRSPRPESLLYSERVRYAEQLRRYHAALGRERVLVLVYDDFRRDNAAVLRRVLRFLEVKEDVEIEPSEANPTVLMRSRQLDDLVHAVSVGRGPLSRTLKRGVEAVSSERMRSHALKTVRRRVLHGAPPPQDERLMAELRRQYAPEVAAASEYLGRDLVSLWGYDRLG